MHRLKLLSRKAQATPIYGSPQDRSVVKPQRAEYVMFTLEDALASTVALQAGESIWLIFLVALSGIVVFIVVAFWRILPLIHKPRATLRLTGKPFQTTSVAIPGVSTSPVSGVASPLGVHSADRAELLQAKSQWERLIEEAESNEQLTVGQRESFVEEARRSLAEINKQLEEPS
jgi:hypothetical protein